tara:strand:- start:353 stop:1201 length:849 start_codon:yes stop_codon:yes gene_type:complete
MANPYFIYWPYGGIQRVEIDMTEPISDIQQRPRRHVEDSMSLNGHRVRSNLTAGLQIRISDERFTARGKWRELSGLINHLEQGYLCGFAEDFSNAYGMILESMTVGSNIIMVDATNWFQGWTAPGLGAVKQPVVGDEIVIESGAWKGCREYFTVAATSIVGTSRRIELDRPVNYRFTDAIVRNADFWPYLQLPKSAVGGALLTHDHRISYTLDLPLDEMIHLNDVVVGNPNGASRIALGHRGADGFFAENINESTGYGLSVLSDGNDSMGVGAGIVATSTDT